MRAITTIFLDNALCAILDHIEQTPDLDPNLPGLIEFKSALIKRVQHLQLEDQLGISSENSCSA
jgi:hypothetical protein